MSDQTGGKLLAQGVDGCVFIPRLKCKGNSQDFLRASRLMVDKLTTRKDAEHEYSIAKKISKIPMASNYFIYPETICTPESEKKQTDPDIKLCEVPVQLKDMQILRMNYGGVSLPYYNFNLNSLSPIQFSRHLLESGALLALNGVVHNDIHMGNILVDQNQVPRIIDFSRSLFVYENLQERDFLVEMAVKSQHICPDFALLNDRILGYKQDMVFKNYIQFRQPLINDSVALYSTGPNKIMEDLEEFTVLSSSYQKLDLIGWFKHHWRTIDSWAIGVDLMTTFNALLYFKEFEQKWKSELQIVLAVIKRLVETNPFRRIDCVQALDMLNNLSQEDEDNIIINNYGKSWLDQVGRVRS